MKSKNKISFTNAMNNSRTRKNDIFYTPKLLAMEIIGMIPLEDNDRVLDPFRGKGAFYDQYPENINKSWCEITDGKDFFEYNDKVDWIISNPPFSIFTKVFEHSVKICEKGFCYIMGNFNLTAKRLLIAKENGFILTHIEPFYVKNWFNFTCFVLIFQKNASNICKLSKITYNLNED